MAIELVSTNVGLDGKRIDVKNNTKLKPSKDNFSFDKDGNISINLPETIVSPDKLSPVKLNTKPEGSMQYLLNTAGNVPQSVKNLAVDYAQPFIHPINTFNAVKSMVVGFRELSNRNKFIKENPNTSPPKMTENMIMAEAVNAHFAERYGDWVGNETDDWDVIGNKFAKSFREDPAGVMADISGVMTLGTIGATKYAGRFGKIAQNISKNIDPVQGLFAGAGKSINAASGKLTGKGSDVLNEAFKAGETGGEANKSFNSGQGNIFKKAKKLTPTQAFKNYIEKLNKYSGNIKATYNDWIEGLPSSYIENLKTPALILREINEIKYGKSGKQKRPFFDQKKKLQKLM